MEMESKYRPWLVTESKEQDRKSVFIKLRNIFSLSLREEWE